MRSLVDSRLDHAAKTVGGLTVKAMKPGPLGHMVDGVLQLGQEGKYLTVRGRKYKCCKHYSGKINTFPTKLVDVTDPSQLPKLDKLWNKLFSGKDGCGTMLGSGWHTHNSKWYSTFNSKVYDGTCNMGLDEFKTITKLDEAGFQTQIEVSAGIKSATTSAECSSSVPGAVLRSAEEGAAFFSDFACQCVAPTVVSGKDIHCSASVEMLRFFNAHMLRGKNCQCAAGSTTGSATGSTIG